MVLKHLVKKLALGTGLAFSLSLPNCAPPEEILRPQYVAENTADVRGTWYQHGHSEGWFGPNKEWGFGWYYLKQYGNELEGKFEYELYTPRASFENLENVRGTITGNQLSLSRLDSLGNPLPNYTVEGLVEGNIITGANIERTSPEIERLKEPIWLTSP